MAFVRDRVRIGLTLLLASQLGGLVALPIEVCCAPAITQSARADCCSKAHAGQTCPMHRPDRQRQSASSREGSTQICATATNILSAVLGPVGLLPPAPLSLGDPTITAAFARQTPTTPALERAPVSPPPRA